MATVRCVVTIKDARGEVVEKFPSTTKVNAKLTGKFRASKIGGDYEVKPVTPVEYKPDDWN